jgi:hypothetical protein
MTVPLRFLLILLVFRLIFCESAWEATGAVFVMMWLIPLYRPFYEKLV